MILPAMHRRPPNAGSAVARAAPAPCGLPGTAMDHGDGGSVRNRAASGPLGSFAWRRSSGAFTKGLRMADVRRRCGDGRGGRG